MSLQRLRMNKVVGFTVSCLMAVPVFAGLSPQLAEWGSGPAQWIMTSEEKRAWRKVTTGDAVDFIDLFWARRDPSPGTAINEFRMEFESRVAYCDQTFVEKRKRGAMTDRGRVFIVLGPATNIGSQLRGTGEQQGSVTGGGRENGARESWIWEDSDARKFDLGRVEVVFVEDLVSRDMRRDPHRTDFTPASAAAIRKAIVSPALTAVPAWASTGGLNPVAPMSTSSAVQPSPHPTTSDARTSDGGVDESSREPVVASNAPGASRLTLRRRGSINARSATDPFAVQSETTFQGSDDIPWAVQYCAAKAELPRLKFVLLMTGPLDRASKEQMTREKEARPERMTTQPGCYVLQGMVPVSKLTAGRYKLSILIDDAATGDTHTVKGEFRVE